MSSERRAVRGKPVTGEEFRKACGRFATGVTIASVMDAQGTPHGLTVSSFTSVSLHPPLILICLGHAVTAIQHFRAATHFGINVLADGQQALSDHFARRGHDRFEGLPWSPGVTGVPMLPDVLASMECAVHRIVPMGDHDILVGEMLHAEIGDGLPLLYFASAYHHL